jgi:hypothetical protein
VGRGPSQSPPGAPGAIAAPQRATGPAVSLPCLLAPRLHADCALAHHDPVGEAAAALTAAELQILQRPIAFSGIDDGLQIGRPR